VFNGIQLVESGPTTKLFPGVGDAFVGDEQIKKLQQRQ